MSWTLSPLSAFVPSVSPSPSAEGTVPSADTSSEDLGTGSAGFFTDQFDPVSQPNSILGNPGVMLGDVWSSPLGSFFDSQSAFSQPSQSTFESPEQSAFSQPSQPSQSSQSTFSEPAEPRHRHDLWRRTGIGAKPTLPPGDF